MMKFYHSITNIKYPAERNSELEGFKTVYTLEERGIENRVELIFGVILRLTPDGRIDPLYIRAGFEAINLQATITIGERQFTFTYAPKLLEEMNKTGFEEMKEIPRLYHYNKNRVGFLLDDLNNPRIRAKIGNVIIDPADLTAIKELLSREYNLEIPKDRRVGRRLAVS